MQKCPEAFLFSYVSTVTLGMAGSYQFDPVFSTAVGSIAIKSCKIIHGPQMTNSTDLGDLLTFLLVPPYSGEGLTDKSVCRSFWPMLAFCRYISIGVNVLQYMPLLGFIVILIPFHNIQNNTALKLVVVYDNFSFSFIILTAPSTCYINTVQEVAQIQVQILCYCT